MNPNMCYLQVFPAAGEFSFATSKIFVCKPNFKQINSPSRV